jgi:hypothetical protein
MKDFCELLNVHGVDKVIKTGMHAANPLVLEQVSSLNLLLKSQKDINYQIFQVLIKFRQN